MISPVSAFKSSSAHSLAASRLSKVALNPQPLPPEPPPELRLAAARSRFDAVALNPQPLPPKALFSTSLLDKVALNPQPLPPRSHLWTLLNKLGLNPQPLPPKELQDVPFKKPIPEPDPPPYAASIQNFVSQTNQAFSLQAAVAKAMSALRNIF